MKHRVGSVEEFAPGTIRIVEVGVRSIGIANTGEGLYAVLNSCPHAQAAICAGQLSGTMLPCDPGEPRYGLHAHILRCPRHRYEFDLADGGRSVFTDYQARLAMYPVSVEGEDVLVEL